MKRNTSKINAKKNAPNKISISQAAKIFEYAYLKGAALVDTDFEWTKEAVQKMNDDWKAFVKLQSVQPEPKKAGLILPMNMKKKKDV